MMEDQTASAEKSSRKETIPFGQREISNEQIAERAYLLWESRGRPDTDGTADWEEAKAQLLAEQLNASSSVRRPGILVPTRGQSGGDRGPLRRLWDRLRGAA